MHLALVAAVCLSMVGFAVAAESQAAMVKMPTNIPAQGLGPALKTLAKDRGLQLVFRSEIVGSARTQGASGNLTTPEALTELLKGTDLSYSYLDENTVTIVPLAASQAPAAAGSDRTNQNNTQDQGGNGKKSSQEFRVAQVDQGQTTGPAAVSKQEEQDSKKKSDLEEIVVTGTHIRGDANPTAPIQVITRKDIERSGYTSTQQLVASIPQNFGGGSVGATADGTLGSGNLANINDSYGTGINLRGLGPSSTLVLLNGHRLAPSADGVFVDISVIPLAAIDRVEIMTDGGSAIYGSDAVAGVVNFILRKDYEGQETWANYGSGTDGTRSQELVGQSVGRNWSGGNAVGTLQYQKQGALSAADRSYTDTVAEPTDLLPRSEALSALFNVRQDLPAGFDIASDVMYSRNRLSNDQTNPFYLLATSPISNNATASIGLGYRPTEKWRIDASGSYSLSDTDFVEQYSPATADPLCGNSPCHSHDIYKEASAEIIASGTLFHLPGGDAKAAFGGSYRNEAFTNVFVEMRSADLGYDRHVSAEVAEFELPIVSAINARLGVKQLELSLAVRRDDYSDFGATTNPRYGVSWKPVDSLHFRGAYSTSFRAPNAFEETRGTGLAQGQTPFLLELTQPAPGGGTVPIFYQGTRTAGTSPLQPEKSRNVTAGLDFEPEILPNFKASVDYFNIRYRDRIITPDIGAAALSQLNVYGTLITPIPSDAAAQAFLNAFQAMGGSFFDLVGTGGLGVRYLFNSYEQNAALVKTDGIDLATNYRFSIRANEFRVALNAAYIHQILTSFTETSTPTDLSNTFGNPLHWRARGEFGWSQGPWSINTAANYSSSYIDTSTVGNPPIASWTTLDAQLSYKPHFAKNLSLSLSGINILNRDPPYVQGQTNALSGIHYDVGNGNPLGRVLVLSARVGW